MNTQPRSPADGRSEVANGIQLQPSKNPPTAPKFSNSKFRIPNFPLTPSPLNPFIPRRLPAAFSLTEVVIALGIFAVSMVGVLALFPVASATSRESSEETQAAILAQTIFDDLIDAGALRGMSNSFVISGPNTVQTGTWTPLNLNTNVVRIVGYDIIKRSGDPLMGVGMMGDPIALKAKRVLTTNDYANSNGVPDVAYLARIQVSPASGLPNLSQVNIQVEAPANLGPTNRRVYSFSSLVTGP